MVLVFSETPVPKGGSNSSPLKCENFDIRTHKILWSSPCSVWDRPCLGKPPAMLWGCSSSPEERASRWGIKASCQWPYAWAMWEADPSAPVGPSCACRSARYLDYNPTRDPEPEPFSQAASRSSTAENGEIIHSCCLKLLNFRIFCYTAIDNWYNLNSFSKWSQWGISRGCFSWGPPAYDKLKLCAKWSGLWQTWKKTLRAYKLPGGDRQTDRQTDHQYGEEWMCQWRYRLSPGSLGGSTECCWRFYGRSGIWVRSCKIVYY